MYILCFNFSVAPSLSNILAALSAPDSVLWYLKGVMLLYSPKQEQIWECHQAKRLQT